MKFIANIIWLIFGGIITALMFFIGGLFFTITIIGIPIAKYCFRASRLALAPFGKEVITKFLSHPIGNTLWAIFFGWEIAVVQLFAGIALFISIIGIPFGFQAFKFMKLGFAPFGAKIK